MGQRRRAAQATDDTDAGEHAVVTQVEVTKQYQFLQAELSVLADNMAKLIQDIGKLDTYKKSMMGELKHLG